MSQAHYSLISYIPDPGRNEALNVGILVWDQSGYRLRIDKEAVDRVVRENRHLERDALLYLEPYLHKQLRSEGPFTQERLLDMLNKQKGFPVVMSEARFTTVAEDRADAIEGALDWLMNRMVRPSKRTGGGGANPVEAFERRLDLLIRQRLVFRNHFFESSRTGIPRPVDFYANSKTNTAMDVARLALKRAKEIRLRADAEAFKVEDVLRQNDNVRFIVYCEFSQAEDLTEPNENARRVLTSSGATVMTDFEEAARTFESVRGR